MSTLGLELENKWRPYNPDLNKNQVQRLLEETGEEEIAAELRGNYSLTVYNGAESGDLYYHLRQGSEDLVGAKVPEKYVK